MKNGLFKIQNILATVLLALLPSLALGASSLKTDFSPARWQQGLHLLAGSGLGGSIFTSENGDRHIGPSLNFKTDVGYYFTKNLALEAGAHVNFIRVASEFLWNSNFILGSRIRIPWIRTSEHSSPYARLFIGYGPTVVLLKGRPRRGIADDVERVQFQGPLVGGSLGLFRKLSNEDPVWFIELTGSIQEFEHMSVVKEHDQVPTVVDDKVITRESTLVNISVTIGFLLF